MFLEGLLNLEHFNTLKPLGPLQAGPTPGVRKRWPFLLDGAPIQVRTSIGIAFFQQSDLSGRDYLQLNDATLYAAHAATHGRYVVFSPTLVPVSLAASMNAQD